MPNLVNDFEVRKETLRALGGNPDGLANIYEVDLEILKLIGEGGGGIDWDTIKQKLAEDGVESIKFTMGNEEVILTAEEVKTLLNQTVLPDAPLDGQQYARQNGEWTPVQTTTVEKYMTITVDKGAWEAIISPNVTGSITPNLQYRVNGGDWNEFIVGTTADITAQPGDVVQFKGLNESGLSTNYDSYLNFAISDMCHLSGNVMSLIDGIGECDTIPNEYCFFRLFYNSNKIRTVSRYFLPATTLKSYCYGDLFRGCESLENSPELPSMKMENSCYHSMFFGCSNLVNPPEILPAVNVISYCYHSMFFDCSNLVNSPIISAISLKPFCCQNMFTRCKKLKYILCNSIEGTINSDGTAPESLYDWLSDVSPTGTFVKHDGVEYVQNSSSGIPSGWTVKEVDVIEVPNDGKTYGRNNGTWTEVESGYPIKQGVQIDNNVVSVENYGQHTSLHGNFIEIEKNEEGNIRLYDKLEVTMPGEESKTASFIDILNAGNGVVKTTSNNTLQFWTGTQQEYDAITTKDANTLYIIK